MRTKPIRVLAASVCFAVLSGCSGGAPSEDEMKAALLLAVSPATDSDAAFESFEAQGCTGKDATYTCKLKGILAYTFRMGDMEQEKRQALAGNYIFMRTENGWRLVR